MTEAFVQSIPVKDNLHIPDEKIKYLWRCYCTRTQLVPVVLISHYFSERT